MRSSPVLVVLFCAYAAVASNDFTYKNKDFWSGVCKLGLEQSPVDLSAINATYYGNLRQPLKISPEVATKVSMTNNGHSVVVSTKDEIIFSGLGLRNNYKLAQLHFHFGSNVMQGSEHTISGRQYPLEMHMVLYRDSYKSLTAAFAAPRNHYAVAVLGTLFEESDSAKSSAFNEIFLGTPEITHPASDHPIDSLDLRKMVPKFTSNFYRYLGSLTTPPCTEGVLWTVFKSPVFISSLQMKMIRKFVKASGTEQMADNYRSVQNINRRNMIRSFALPGEKSGPMGHNVNEAQTESPSVSDHMSPMGASVQHGVKTAAAPPVKTAKTSVGSDGVRHVSIDLALKVDAQ